MKKKIGKKITRRSRISRRNNLAFLLKKTEFWAGVVTVLVVIGLLTRLPFKPVIEGVKSYRIMIVHVTPLPTVSTPKVASPVKTATNNSIKTYVIQEGDSYSTATQKICGDDNFYIFNQDLNQAKPLVIGETLQIRCDWE